MRGGFVLIGAFVVATAVSGIGKSISYGMAVQGSSFTSTLVIGALIGAVIGVIPGLFLVLRARHLASRVFPGEPPDPPIDLGTLLFGLSALLGAFLIVVAIGDLVAGIAIAVSMAASSLEFAIEPGRDAISAIVRLGAGLFLFFRAELVANVLAEGP